MKELKKTLSIISAAALSAALIVGSGDILPAKDGGACFGITAEAVNIKYSGTNSKGFDENKLLTISGLTNGKEYGA